MSSTRRVRGFTLIEILVVITIIGLLMSLAVPAYSNIQEKARVNACQQNLKQIATNLTLWRSRKDQTMMPWPKESGVRFLLVLARDNMIDPKDMKLFLCPGTNDDNTLQDNPAPGAAYADWDQIDPTTVSYAGRDTKNFPINKSKEGDEVIASDDNDQRNNHRSQTCYVYADATTAAFDRDTNAAEEGVTFEKDEVVTVGADSKLEKFRKLQID